MKADTFPLGLRLEGKACLVVGSGDEAELRTNHLVLAGARVRLISERPTPRLVELESSGKIAVVRRSFEEPDLDGAWLVVQTDRDASLAERIGRAAEARQIFFCAIDQPTYSTFSHLALARSGPVTVAISTNGVAPSLARRLREELERVLTAAGVGEFAKRLAVLRAKTPPEARRETLGRAVSNVRFEGTIALPDDDADE
ncbi:MAG TPA: bifunctional precorrin-2 dehydrogenase/sirohydrochlorin ferrochelatase [Polyangiaceae bacterium]|jgi:siroheme synthase-like protein|nr:bifunctional precorrin-2 dehydrogenase/sirohydrochlorin ferrochelatase [Polyangiaceae bacterium]